MAASFSRTVGPKADVAELEYVAALHQTCALTTRRTGTISSMDVVRFLKSRHGVEISHTEARDIVVTLGGGTITEDVRTNVAASVAQKLQAKASAEKAMPPHKKWRGLGSSLKRSPREKTDNLPENTVDGQIMTTSATEQAAAEEENERRLLLIEEILSPKMRYLDIVQMTSVILIPTIARVAKEWYLKELDKIEDLKTSKKVKEQMSVEVAFSEQPTSTYQDGDSLSPQPKDLLQIVLQSMCSAAREAKTTTNTSGSSDEETLNAQLGGPPLVTPEMVKLLLTANGEMELANDLDLVQRMVDVATSAVNPGYLDESALVQALTADLKEWDVGCEDQETTYVYDVFGDSSLKAFAMLRDKAAEASDAPMSPPNDVDQEAAEKEKTQAVADEQKKSGSKQADAQPAEDASGENYVTTVAKESHKVLDNMVDQLAVKGTFTVLDSVVDAYASTLTLLLAWMTFLGHTGTYATLILQMDAFTYECPEETFGCILGTTILSW
jgi:hypothetical protein